MYRCLGLLIALVPALGLSGAPQTFRDYQCGTTVSVGSERPSTLLKDVAARADLIVRARIGRGTSHLAKNPSEIHTTYELVNPQVLFASPSATRRVSDHPESLVLAQRGGTIFRDGKADCPLSMVYEETTALTPGMDAVLLLVLLDDEFLDPLFGVFEVRDSAIVLPKAELNDGEQFKGLAVDRFIGYVLSVKETGR